METKTGTKPSKASQAARVLAYLKTRQQLTQLEALQELGVMRLASRIDDLRNDGHNITTEMVTIHNRYGEACRVASYRLVAGKQGAAA